MEREIEGKGNNFTSNYIPASQELVLPRDFGKIKARDGGYAQIIRTGRVDQPPGKKKPKRAS